MSFATSLENATVQPKVSASEAIPPVAQPFVSDKARKMIDLVCFSSFFFLSVECIHGSTTCTGNIREPDKVPDADLP